VKTFAITRGGAAPYLIFLPIGVLLVALAGAFVYFVVGPKTLAVADSSVTAAGAMYSATVDRASIVRDEVRVVDLDREPQLSPSARTNGLDLFTYQEGWFRLHNGEKAFVVMSNPKSVLYIPTRAGHVLLFSAADPEKAQASLR
jgi:hypothetical protein